MNNYPYPFIPMNNNQFNILEEIKKLKAEIKKLNEKIDAITTSKEKDYLKKDDSFYML